MSPSELTAQLRSYGHRVTRPRRAVYEALEHAETHLTADELAWRVQQRHPGVNIASVYRSLALFADIGLARETRLGDSDAARWEISHPDEHFHVVCERCGHVDHHVGQLVHDITEHLRAGHGFHARTVDLTVTGRCRECAG